MPDRLLRKSDIAAMLGTSPGVAASILRKHGCHPIDFGRGAGRGQRWLESAVTNAIRIMHMEAQPAPPKQKKIKPSNIPEISLANMKSKDAYALLTRDNPVQ